VRRPSLCVADRHCDIVHSWRQGQRLEVLLRDAGKPWSQPGEHDFGALAADASRDSGCGDRRRLRGRG